MAIKLPIHFRWWLVLMVIVFAVPRLLSFDFALPYIDHVDEPEIYVEALAWRGHGNPMGVMAAYPPGSLVQNMLVQSILEPLGYYGAAPTVYVTRLISTIANLFGLVCIALAARLIAGDLAGVVAGVAWGLAPRVISNGVYALADPMVYMFSALALWLAMVALVDGQRRYWCVWSVIAGLLATLYKYPAIPAMVPGGLVALLILARDRRAGVRYLVIQALAVGLVGLFLIFIYRIDRLDMGVTRRAESSFVDNLLNPARTVENLRAIVQIIDFNVFLLYTLIALPAYWYTRRRGRQIVKTGGLLIAGITLLLFAWVVSAFSTVSTTSRIRDLIPAVPMICVLLGAFVAQIAAALPLKWTVVRATIALLPLLIFVYPTQIQNDVELVQRRQIPDRRVDLARWADTSLDPGTIIVSSTNARTFNPNYGGLRGRFWRDWWVTDNIREYSVAEWIERGMTFAALERWQWEAFNETEAGRAYLEPMLHLRSFVSPPTRNGPETIVLRLWRMQHETDVGFGDTIRLVGYDLDETELSPGGSINLKLYWQASQRPDINYSLFVHLSALDEHNIYAQLDASPTRETRPTITWDDLNETLVSQTFTLEIPPNVEMGDYRLIIGLYNFATGERLPVITENNPLPDALVLSQIKLVSFARQ